MERIDFVIPWVDGSDPLWVEQFLKYKQDSELVDSSKIRYRDWDNLHYWFRAVERFAPWVSKIHFITWGHIPAWLNTSNPKLNIVCHEDYIPKEYLPVFSSHPIELNMHRIEGLSERFVYFNDDCFLVGKSQESRFFRGTKPCDMARLSIIPQSSISHIVMNNVEVINRRHKKAITRDFFKWLSPRYSLCDIVKTLTLMPWSSFAGFQDSHMPQPFLKSTFEKMWREENKLLDATCRNRFRSLTDVNQYLMRYEQLVCGEFHPVSMKDTKLDMLCEERIDQIAKYIEQGQYTLLCLNDSDDITDFEAVKQRLNSVFDSLLPTKSSYEL